MHSLAHPLSTVCGMHHGLANALNLVSGMKFCAARKPGLYRRVGIACGLDIMKSSDADADQKTIQFISTFLADLDQRGLLDQTLVVMMGEMGRTPKVNAKGGRDHWTYCYSVVFAGGGNATTA